MTRAERPDNTKLAVIVIIFTVLGLSLGDALIKLFSANLVLWQIFVLRSALALPVLLIIWRAKFAAVPLMPKALGWTLARSFMLAFMWVAYYAALPHVQLSIAAAAYYTLPIFITLFSALFVGERVTATGWFAVALGFIGVLFILKPAASDFNAYALMPLISAVLYALAMILTRTKCRAEHPIILSGALNVVFIAVGLAATLLLRGIFVEGDTSFLSPYWARVDSNSAAVLGLLAIAIIIGSVGAAIAYQIGRSSVIATFDFAYVGFAVLWGLVFFAEVPDAISLLGIALVVIAGILAVRQGST